LLDHLDKATLDYLDVCALKHKIEDRDNPKELLKLALELELQSQATHYIHKALETESFASLCQNLAFKEVGHLARLCKYSGETECEKRVKDLVSLEPQTSLADLVTHCICKPSSYEDYRASIHRHQEEER